MADKIRIGITQGDVNGIGLEVTVKSLANSDILELFTPVIFGDPEVVREVASALNAEDFNIYEAESAAEAKDGVVNVVAVGARASRTPGRPSAEAGAAAVAALEAAAEAIAKGDIDLLVTAPIDKNSVQGETFRFPGHTEYLEDKFRLGDGSALMILAHGNLRVSLVTTHLPLAEVASKIKRERVAKAIRAFNSALRMDFGCERPKIAVLSLNPHGGDGGLLGREEVEEIIPGIEDCRQEGILAFGPVAADGLFGSGAYMKYDGVLAMYHDQGLAPFKAIANGGGVNFTAGLDIVRTSPAHGTAYDKAGKGTADESSMRDALYAAIDIARCRTTYLDASENPLEIRPAQRNPRKKDKSAASDHPRRENTPAADSPTEEKD